MYGTVSVNSTMQWNCCLGRVGIVEIDYAQVQLNSEHLLIQCKALATQLTVAAVKLICHWLQKIGSPHVICSDAKKRLEGGNLANRSGAKIWVLTNARGQGCW